MNALRIFVSSTYEDLKEERIAVKEAILSMNLVPAGMELFAAGTAPSLNVIEDAIEKSDMYVLIIGWRYGSTLKPEMIQRSTLFKKGLLDRKYLDCEEKYKLSYTEYEYHYARYKGIPILTFVRYGSSENPNFDRFIKEVGNSHNYQQWKSQSELASGVMNAIRSTMDEQRKERDDYFSAINRLCDQIRMPVNVTNGFPIDLIVGITHGGLIVADYIACMLGSYPPVIGYYPMRSARDENNDDEYNQLIFDYIKNTKGTKKIKNILLVDSCTRTGESLKKAREFLEKKDVRQELNIRTLVVFAAEHLNVETHQGELHRGRRYERLTPEWLMLSELDRIREACKGDKKDCSCNGTDNQSGSCSEDCLLEKLKNLIKNYEEYQPSAEKNFNNLLNELKKIPNYSNKNIRQELIKLVKNYSEVTNQGCKDNFSNLYKELKEIAEKCDNKSPLIEKCKELLCPDEDDCPEAAHELADMYRKIMLSDERINTQIDKVVSDLDRILNPKDNKQSNGSGNNNELNVSSLNKQQIKDLIIRYVDWLSSSYKLSIIKYKKCGNYYRVCCKKCCGECFDECCNELDELKERLLKAYNGDISKDIDRLIDRLIDNFTDSIESYIKDRNCGIRRLIHVILKDRREVDKCQKPDWGRIKDIITRVCAEEDNIYELPEVKKLLKHDHLIQSEVISCHLYDKYEAPVPCRYGNNGECTCHPDCMSKSCEGCRGEETWNKSFWYIELVDKIVRSKESIYEKVCNNGDSGACSSIEAIIAKLKKAEKDHKPKAEDLKQTADELRKIVTKLESNVADFKKIIGEIEKIANNPESNAEELKKILDKLEKILDEQKNTVSSKIADLYKAVGDPERVKQSLAKKLINAILDYYLKRFDSLKYEEFLFVLLLMMRGRQIGVNGVNVDCLYPKEGKDSNERKDLYFGFGGRLYDVTYAFQNQGIYSNKKGISVRESKWCTDKNGEQCIRCGKESKDKADSKPLMRDVTDKGDVLFIDRLETVEKLIKIDYVGEYRDIPDYTDLTREIFAVR